MSKFPDNLLNRVNALCDGGSYNAARELLNSLLKAEPNSTEVLMKMAYVSGLEHKFKQAVSEVTKAVLLSPGDPSTYITRGRFLFQLHEYKDAIIDFTKTLELCDYHNDNFYRNASLFARAEAYLRTKQFAEALVDCTKLPDGFQSWSDQLRTKAQMVAEAHKGLEQRR